MSRLQNLPYSLQKSFATNSLLKVIAGLNNFDENLVRKICRISKTKFEKLVNVSNERIGKDHSYNLSSKKIKNELNWRAKIDLETGIHKTLQWIDKNIIYLSKEKLNYVHSK